MRSIVRHARSVGLKRFALVHPADAFGAPALAIYRQALADTGGQDVAVVSVPNVSSTDFDKGVDQLRAARADVVIAYLSQTFPEFLRLYRDRGVPSQLYTISLAYSSKLMEMKPEHVRGVGVTQTTPSPWDETRPVVREFLRDRKLDGAKVPITFGALEGYIAGKLLVEGLRRAGPNPSPELLRSALAKSRIDIGGLHVPNGGEGASYVEIGVLDESGRYRR